MSQDLDKHLLEETDVIIKTIVKKIKVNGEKTNELRQNFLEDFKKLLEANSEHRMEVYAYGSFITQLLTPYSDLDVCVCVHDMDMNRGQILKNLESIFNIIS